MTLKKTPLYHLHVEQKAKLIDFGGWCMPVSFSSVIDEHKTVREKCGIFDVSHMGEIVVRGKNSHDFLQRVTINDVQKLAVGKGQYTAILNREGGFIDDLILYRIEEDAYLACVNAGNIEKDFEWLASQKQSSDEVEIENKSESFCQIAIQGPDSENVLKECLPDLAESILSISYMDIIQVEIQGERSYLARTGYTGEKGYEVYLPPIAGQELWKMLQQSDIKWGVKPIGLGARDTLRLEACYLLYGQDMNETTSPLEAGIGWATKLESSDFVGKEKLLEEKKLGRKRKIIGFLLKEKGIPRAGMTIYKGEDQIGTVTSGSFLPSINAPGGMALVDFDSITVGDQIEIDIRGKRKLAEVKKRPLYSAKVK